MVIQRTPLRMTVLALYALAVGLVGFAHRPVVLPSLPALSQIWCGDATSSSPDEDGRQAAQAPCEACLLAQAPGLLPAAAEHALPPSQIRARMHLPAAQPLRLTRLPLPRPRAGRPVSPAERPVFSFVLLRGPCHDLFIRGV